MIYWKRKEVVIYDPKVNRDSIEKELNTLCNSEKSINKIGKWTYCSEI